MKDNGKSIEFDLPDYACLANPPITPTNQIVDALVSIAYNLNQISRQLAEMNGKKPQEDESNS